MGLEPRSPNPMGLEPQYFLVGLMKNAKSQNIFENGLFSQAHQKNSDGTRTLMGLEPVRHRLSDHNNLLLKSVIR